MTLTLRSPAFVGSLLLYPNYVQDYLDRVTAADVAAGNTSGLERGVTDAFNTALQALVADTYLGISGNVITQAASTIKAMPWMMGARTLSGCLVPVVGPAPTNVNFVSGDYNRKMGPQGNGTTKYLNTNYANDADPQNDKHFSTNFSSSIPSSGSVRAQGVAANGAQTGGTSIAINTTTNNNDALFRINGSVPVTVAGVGLTTGFRGASRNSSSSLTARIGGANYSGASTSETPQTLGIFVFARNITGGGTTASDFFNASANYYSVGRSLDLAILQTRIDTLTAAIAAAIP